MTLKWNPDLRPPRYYGHFFWPPGKNDHTFSCTETLVSTVTSLLQPNFFGPLVAVLTGFHCICLRSQWIESLRLRIVESSYIPYDYIHRSSRYNFHSLDTALKKQQPFKKMMTLPGIQNRLRVLQHLHARKLRAIWRISVKNPRKKLACKFLHELLHADFLHANLYIFLCRFIVCVADVRSI